MKKIQLLIPFLLSLGIAHAVPQWELDTSGWVDGAAVPTASYVAGEVNTIGQTISATNSEATAGANRVVFQNSYSAGSATLNNAIVLYKTPDSTTNTNVEYRFQSNRADFEPGASYQVQFDLLIPDTGLTGTPFNVRLTPITNSVSIAALAFNSSGNISMSSSYTADDAFALADGWSANTIHTITIQYDGEANSVSAYVDTTLIGTYFGLAGHPVSSSISPTDDNRLGAALIRFRGNNQAAGFTDGIAIANIVANGELIPIPEPGQIALVSGILMLLFVWYRRRK